VGKKVYLFEVEAQDDKNWDLIVFSDSDWAGDVYVALLEAVKEISFIFYLLRGMGIPVK
jgi:hypothetical protein